MAGRASRAPGPVLASGDAQRAAASPTVPSFQAVYRQYFDFVWSSARRLGVEPESMDDLVQEVFIVMHARLDSLKKPEALRSFIYGVVRRTVSTHRRAKRARPVTGFTGSVGPEAVSCSPTPLEHAEANAELRLLAALLDELDEPKRELFAMVELEELSVPEAADVLEIPLNTAYSRLRLAREAFEAALSRHRARSGRGSR